MVQGKITEADTPTIRLGATPPGLISDPPPSSIFFTPDALPEATLSLYPRLGQATIMLACIPHGVVKARMEVNLDYWPNHPLSSSFLQPTPNSCSLCDNSDASTLQLS